MSAETEQYRTVCKAEFQAVHSKLDKLDEAIRGNGRPGIQTRLDRLERFSHFVWFIVGAAVSAGIAVAVQRIGG
jgi:tetrahydromethanopterin S-methyltransferase subunit G